MKSSCVRTPQSNQFIQLFAWQVEFCKNNHCAALLLSYFICWHDWKLRNDQYYRRANDIAEMHSDGRPYSENAYLFFSSEQLIEGCMGLYGRKAITDGLDILEKLGVISVHKNPNPRYHFDKTKYFQFYPEICNQWIAKHYPNDGSTVANSTQTIDCYDKVKVADRLSEKELPLREINQPSSENSQAITDTTNNTTKQNKSINSNDDVHHKSIEPDMVETIVEVLVEKGISRSRFYPDAIKAIQQLHAGGATLNHFLSGYDVAVKCTKSKGFGVNYLVKVVDSLLVKSKQTIPTSSIQTSQEPIYRSDFKNAKSWAGDLI